MLLLLTLAGERRQRHHFLHYDVSIALRLFADGYVWLGLGLGQVLVVHLAEGSMVGLGYGTRG